jgi:hypothetical protein
MITLAMKRTYRDITTASSSDVPDDDESNQNVDRGGEVPAYQQALQQRQSRDPTLVPSTTTSASADNNTQLRQIVTPSGGDEFVDILQVQQLLLENAGVSSASSVSDSGRGGVLGHTQRPTAAEYPHLGLTAALRGRMLFDSYPPTTTAVPTQSHHHHHHHPPQPPPPLPPYYYANYMQQHQQQPSNVEDLFALWLGSSGTGRSYCFIYDWF